MRTRGSRWRLPDELWVLIFEHCSREGFLTLLRTCVQLRNLAGVVRARRFDELSARCNVMLITHRGDIFTRRTSSWRCNHALSALARAACVRYSRKGSTLCSNAFRCCGSVVLNARYQYPYHRAEYSDFMVCAALEHAKRPTLMSYTCTVCRITVEAGRKTIDELRRTHTHSGCLTLRMGR